MRRTLRRDPGPRGTRAPLTLLVLVLLPLACSALVLGDDIGDLVDVFNQTTLEQEQPEVEPVESVEPAALGSVRKCCPPGQSMFRVNAPGCEHQVTCKIPDAEPASTLWSLQPGGGQYGFPISCPRERCHLVLLEGGEQPARTPFCVDKLVLMDDNGQLLREAMAGMACVASAAGTELELLRNSAEPSTSPGSPSPGAPAPGRRVPLRKCCPVHRAYDLALRRCVDGEATEEGLVSSSPPPPLDYQKEAVNALHRKVFDKNLSALVDQSVGGPICDQTQAALDVAVFDLAYDERLVDDQGVATLRPQILLGGLKGSPMLMARTQTWSLQPGEFCVDETVNTSGALVVRACRPRPDPVCGSFGCFRKCCPHDKYFAPVGSSHACVPRPPRAPPLLPQVRDTEQLHSALLHEKVQ